MIPENVKTRLLKNGRLRQQLRIIREIVKKNPDSEYAKTVYKTLKKKFWYGSNRITYYDIFSEAWSKFNKDNVSEMKEIGGFKIY